MLVKPRSDTVRACGGYADKCWQSREEEYAASTKAFLFRFDQSSGGGSRKRERVNCREDKTHMALCHDEMRGPAFGEYDLDLCYPDDAERNAAGSKTFHTFADGRNAVGGEGSTFYEQLEWEVFSVMF